MMIRLLVEPSLKNFFIDGKSMMTKHLYNEIEHIQLCSYLYISPPVTTPDHLSKMNSPKPKISNQNRQK